MKNWKKIIALVGILALSISMLSGCQVGRNYSDEMMGNKDGLPKFYKDQEIEVPYTGDTPIEVIQTDDPVLAGKCDADGNLLDGSGKVDLSNLGGSSSGGSSSGNSGSSGSSSSGGGNSNSGSSSGGDNGGDEEDISAKYEADESGTKVRIMTQNVRNENATDADIGFGADIRMYRLQKLVEKNDPDILGMQECDDFWVEAFPQLFSPKYTMSYEYRGGKGSNEACVILWKTEKYKLLTKGTFWLSETPNQYSTMNDQYYPRIAHWVKLEDKATGEKILFFSTHFGFPKSESHPDGYTQAQIVYLRGLFTKVMAQHPDAYPFAVGDFNIHFDTESYLSICDGKDIVDLREIAKEMKMDGHCTIGDIRKGTNSAFNNDNGSGIIDYIFGQPRKNQAVDYYTILYDRIAIPERGIAEGPVSDHFGVLADVRINTEISYANYYGKNAR